MAGRSLNVGNNPKSLHGRTQPEHDQRLEAMLEKLQESGLTLNKDKCVFSQPKVKFPSGISQDSDKVSAVVLMRESTDVSEVRRHECTRNSKST